MLAYYKSCDLIVTSYLTLIFLNYPDYRKLISKYIYMMIRGAIPQKISCNQIIVTSIMEAKCIACHEKTCETIWLRNMMFGFKVVQTM